MSNPILQWKEVASLWWAVDPNLKMSVGAIGRKPDGWHAVMEDTELPLCDSLESAKQACEDFWQAIYDKAQKGSMGYELKQRQQP